MRSNTVWGKVFFEKEGKKIKQITLKSHYLGCCANKTIYYFEKTSPVMFAGNGNTTAAMSS